MKTLYIDTHCTKKFEIGYDNNITFQTLFGSDTSIEILEKIDLLCQNNIDKIIICKGPGSLTGLRIGSCFAQGIALAKKIPVYGMTIWDVLFAENPLLEVFFYTGTKKWIYKTINSEIVQETPKNPKQIWTSNNPELLTNFDQKTYQKWPKIVILMQKHHQKATKNIDLLYPINLFNNISI